MTTKSLKRLILIFLFISSLVVFLKPLTFDYYPDFAVYYWGTSSYVQGLNPYVNISSIVGFSYPPTTLLFFLPLVVLPYLLAQQIFLLFSISCFFISVFLLFRIFKVRPFSNLGLFLLILVLNFFPEKFTLGMGQVNNVVLLSTTLFIYFLKGKRALLSGLFLGISIALKLFPVLLIFYLVIKKEKKILLSFIATLIGFALAVFLLVDRDTIFYFSRHLLPALLGGIKADYYNQALSGLLIRQFAEVELVGNLKNLIGGILVLFTLVQLYLHRKNEKISLMLIAILISLTLIINAFSWQHHFVFLIIPYTIVFFYIKNNSLGVRYYLILALSFFLVALNLKNPDAFPIIFQSHVLYGAVILYLLEAYLIMRSR